MKAKTGETRRMLLASLFMLVSLGAALLAVFSLALSFIALGNEEWLKAGAWFVAAAMAVPLFVWSWKHLQRYRPTGVIAEKWRARFRRESTAGEKFAENLNAYTGTVLGAAFLFAVLLAAFGATLQSADSTLGTRLQFLVLLIAFPAALVGCAIGIRKDIMAFAPAGEPVATRTRSLWRSICFFAVTVCLLLVSGAFLGFGAVFLVALTFFPANFNDPIDTLITAAACLIACGFFACMAFPVLRDEWKRRRAPSGPEPAANSTAAEI